MKKRKQKKGFVIVGIVGGAAVILAGGGILAWKLLINTPTPQEIVKNYFSLVEKGNYEQMYGMLSEASKEKISEKEFVERNQNIYEGIEARNIQISLSEKEKLKGSPVTVKYSETMQTIADEISFDNEITLQKEEGDYKIEWDSTVIFPNLQDIYKVQIQTETAKRGTIYDRNGTVLEVGLVPGKMGEEAGKAESIQKLVQMLEVSEESIQTALGTSYVKEDSFVPIKKISKGNTEKEEQLLAIPGVMLNDSESRVYPLGAAAGHLTGYVQGQTQVNPLHLLSMYSMFVNGGNMIQPVLRQEEAKEATFWKEQVITEQTAQIVRQSLLSVIETADGTGASAKINGVTMLGKTGTAEIKESQDDTTGIERGWFICETTEEMPTQIAVVGMVEDVKIKGGSGYVTQKVRNIAASYL